MNESETALRYPLGPALGFLERMWRLEHALERVSGSMQKKLGVTAQQRLIVRCLGRYPGLTAGQLASILHVDPGTLSAALRRLEDKQLIERRQDPRDKRRLSLGLTKLGRVLDTPAQGTVEHAVERLLEATSEADLLAAARVLDRLTTCLDEELTSSASGARSRSRTPSSSSSPRRRASG